MAKTFAKVIQQQEFAGESYSLLLKENAVKRYFQTRLFLLVFHIVLDKYIRL